jgi:HSP20 family molecular chaperone IbpA
LRPAYQLKLSHYEDQIKTGENMANIPITKVKENGAESLSLLGEMKALAERVRQRAYELFQSRHSRAGSPLDDWLKAERELIWAPESDLVEKNGQFQLQIAVPGFDAKDIKVTAFSDALAVCAESAHRHEKSDGNVYFCEFGEKTLFRKFELPAPIDVDKVTARLEKGVLQISAAKNEPAPGKASATAA